MNHIDTIRNGGTALRLMICSDSIIRVTFGENPDAQPDSIMISPDFTPRPDVPVSRTETEQEYTVVTDTVKVTVDKQSLAVRFERPDGTVLSHLSGHSLTEYEMQRTVGGHKVTRETVDGVRVTVKDGEREFLRLSHHGRLIMKFSED